MCILYQTNNFSLRLKKINNIILVDKKNTNKWLAEQMGCTLTIVRKWCTNAYQPPIDTFVKIA